MSRNADALRALIREWRDSLRRDPASEWWEDFGVWLAARGVLAVDILTDEELSHTAWEARRQLRRALNNPDSGQSPPSPAQQDVYFLRAALRRCATGEKP